MKRILRTVCFIWKHPLASRSRPRAFWSWFYWQMRSRISGRAIIVPFVENARLVVERGMTGATGNIYCGLHEFEDMAFVLHFLRPGDLFCDIGANVGSYTILAAKVTGARCLAVEPVPKSFQRLRRNLKINTLGTKVHAVQCAAGNTTGEALFSVDMDATNRVVDEMYRGRSISVPVRTVDELLGNESATMWKIDVEGFERKILAGAARALENSELQAVLLESNDVELEKIMTRAGFFRCNYDPFSRQLEKTNSIAVRQNDLWVRNISAVQSRCISAPKRRVFCVEF